jgi:hypothetical protein
MASASGGTPERRELPAGAETFGLSAPLPVHLVGQELQGQHAVLLGSCADVWFSLWLRARAVTMLSAHGSPTAWSQELRSHLRAS